MDKFYRTSLICGLTPLCIGMAVLISWVFVQSNFLMMAGFVNICLGFALFFVGSISLTIYFIKAFKSRASNYWKKTLIAMFVLLVNFPATIASIKGADYISNITTVIIENQSNIAIQNVYITSRHHSYKIDEVLPDETVKKWCYFKSESPVKYSFTINGTKHEGVLIGYPDTLTRYKLKITITESGEVKMLDLSQKL